MGKKPGTSRKKAIQAALGQLGWQASAKDVVAHLASYGITVSEGLVSRVKVESLKRPDEVKRHEEKLKGADKRRRRPMIQKKPQQRTYRR
jgi:hypothetical protein